MKILLRPICWIFGHNAGSVGGFLEGYQCERCNKWGIGASNGRELQ